MANESGIIDKLVAQKAIDEVENLQKKLTELLSKYTEVASKMAEGISFKAGSMDDLVTKSAQYQQSIDKIKALEAQFKTVTEQLAASQSKLISLEEKLSNTRKSGSNNTNKLTEYEKQLAKSKNDHYKEIVKLVLAEEQLNSAILNEAKTVNQAREQNKILTTVRNSLNVEIEEEAQKISQLNGIINKNNEIIRSNGDNMLKQKMNIGNYTSHWNGLNNAMAQITREGPAFANSLTTGFMAISNNIPILADAIQQVRMENAALRAEGKPTTSVFKQIVSSLFSWQTALSLGVVLLTVYGKQIVEWIGSLLESEKVIRANDIALTSLNNAKRQGITDSQKERVELGVLYNAAINDKKSKEERLAAVNKLQEQYPYYFKNLDAEIIMAGNAETAYNKLAGSLLKNAIAKAKLSELDKLSTQGWELSMQAAGKLMEIEQARIDMQKKIKISEIFNADPEAKASAVKDANDAINRVTSLTDEYNTLTSSIRSTNEAQKQLAGSINVKDLTTDFNKDTLENQQKEEEKKLKEQEKAARKREKLIEDRNKILKSIEDTFNQEQAISLNDSLQKELASISKKYSDEKEKLSNEGRNKVNLSVEEEQKRIDALKLLNENEQKEKERKTAEYVQKIAEIDAQNTLDSMEKNSGEYLNAKVELLEIQRDRELSEAEKTGADIELINKKYNNKIQEANNEYWKGQVSITEEGFAKDAVIRNQKQSDELVELSKLYKNGKITKEQYEKQKVEITEKYALDELRIQIDNAEKIAQTLSGDDKIKALKDVEKLRIDLAKKTADAEIKANEDSVEKRKQKTKELLNASKEILGAISSFGSALYEGQIQKVDEELDAVKNANDEKIASIEKLEESGAITKEEAEARKQKVEAQTAAKEKALNAKKAELQTRQAKFEKATNIAKAMMDTASAVIEALPTIPLSILAGTIGAIQLATIIATPIPKYAKGTESHKGGMAVVGDAGKKEGIFLNGKLINITPDIPTLMDIPFGAQVIPDINSKEFTDKIMNNSYNLTHDDKGQRISVITDFSKLESRISRLESINNNGFNKVVKTLNKNNSKSDFRNYISSRI